MIAVHCAFPILLTVLFYTFLSGIGLLLFMSPVLVTVTLLSPDGGGYLDVGRNKLLMVLLKVVGVLLLLIYLYLASTVS